ncbi:hypothetical protein KVP10_08350 [Candidimonas humi]|uniref:Uncharacterized protein n=1 Tax=Candidimonas humi TaxID=683355 RepID=A0ABV8NUS6_9BURK|nr:hypothetical protein [Candidimonas humi]MBV6304896.1 hypothetical protein [Candidimonas humi]
MAAILAVCAPLAFAHGNNYGNQGPSGGVIAGGAAGFGGSASGSAASNSTGSVAAGTEVVGSGYSLQAAGAISGGSATIGGQVAPSGATVNTGTTQYAVSGGFGATDQVGMQGNSILNGNSAFSSSDNTASGTANFATGAIGGIAGFQSIGDFSHNNW